MPLPRLFGVGQRDDNLIGSHDAEIAPDEFVGKVAIDVVRIEQRHLPGERRLLRGDLRRLPRDRRVLRLVPCQATSPVLPEMAWKAK